MNQKRWIIPPVLLGLFLPYLFFTMSVQTSARQLEITTNATATRMPTATVTYTPFPTFPPFSATMHVDPAQTIIEVGEQVSVQISIDVSEGCQYPVLELNLTQSGEEAPLFSYISPTTDTIWAPGPGPYVFTLLAEQAGVVTFDGLAYGERYCGDYWNWHYVGAPSIPVIVTQPLYNIYLPGLLK